MMGGGPVERGEEAGERSQTLGYVVGDDRQAEERETRGIAVGVHDEVPALASQRGSNPLDDRHAADAPETLVAAAQAGRGAARENDADHEKLRDRSDIGIP